MFNFVSGANIRRFEIQPGEADARFRQPRPGSPGHRGGGPDHGTRVPDGGAGEDATGH